MKRTFGLRRKRQPFRMIAALEKDQSRRHGDVSSSTSPLNDYSHSATSSCCPTTASSVSAASSLTGGDPTNPAFARRRGAGMKNQGTEFRRRRSGMDNNCGVQFQPHSLSEPISAVEPHIPKRRESDQYFLDGLSVIDPDSRERFEDLLNPDIGPFDVQW
mmetsp:Transcript_1963/g.3050  ORF Transcript_1963/g.3050 Transcript_1963/m.3050 type:complete len:160 (+) Transcript_1963:165-644(+)|eukprot:CAMPEP_0119004606 /NCGR_PEP_ID=MMETSP1176-20130426/1243_1 /TAXON_ID=265551 /ORGANISM="Synedropsis recta cf, Strain CCMP1620" /LENGTH=159 /DNA_ID=CAMNT_0006956335 /DNA_START=150 /DNA_END=626 /DNA_ORIENTATION=-